MNNEIEIGEKVFVDANIFIYHFIGRSVESRKLLIRCQDKELSGFTSIVVLFEVLHRLMMIEALEKKLITSGNIVKKLREKPEIVRKLSDYNRNTMLIYNMGIQIISFTENIIERSFRFRTKYGLLTNDSLICSAMETENITHLITSDRDFERVEWISVHVPGDIRD